MTFCEADSERAGPPPRRPSSVTAAPAVAAAGASWVRVRQTRADRPRKPLMSMSGSETIADRLIGAAVTSASATSRATGPTL